MASSALQYLRDVILRGAVGGTLGAPMDIAALGAKAAPSSLQTLRGEVPLAVYEDNPIGSSEWLGQKMQDYGLVSEERRPLAELAAGVAVPFVGPARTLAAKGGAKALPFLKEATSYLGVPETGAMLSHVIKPKGGNWLSGSVEGALKGLKSGNVYGEIRPLEGPFQPGYPEGSAYHPTSGRLYTPEEVQRLASNGTLDNWIDKQLTRYVKNEMATPEDPVRALAERGVLHVDPEQLGMRGANRANLHALRRQRGELGFPERGFANTPGGASWENAADIAADQTTASFYQQKMGDDWFAEQDLKENPWLNKLAPEVAVYKAPRALPNELGFNHLIDELRNSINPDSGLPPELLLKYESLPKVSVPQAVERVAKINAWRAAQQAEANAKLANNAATSLVKEYPEGFRWVELKKPQDTGRAVDSTIPEVSMTREDAVRQALVEDYRRGTPEFEQYVTELMGEPMAAARNVNEDEAMAQLRNALKYEGDTMGHCVGGYCDDVASGATRIFSLRDAKGQPHTTIEVVPTPDHVYAGEKNNEIIRLAEERGIQKYLAPGNEKLWAEAEANLAVRGIKPQMKIQQIKGKANRKPNPEYLPFVQDFVRTQGPWSDVQDLHHTDLMPVDALMKGQSHPGFSDYMRSRNTDDMSLDLYDARRKAAARPEGDYLTIEEWLKHLGYADGGRVPHYAHGGSVGYNADLVQQRADDLARELGL